MKEILVDELKRLQLDILSDIHSFCIKNKINYSLAYGTLLGAVRHKGYIPWDDDIDILMRREDYERFLKIYVHDYYSIADSSTVRGYYLPFAKVCDNRTVMMEKTTQKVQIGVYIDVFPVDNMPDSERELDKMFSEKKILNFIHNLKVVAVDRNRSIVKNISLAMAHILLSIVPITRVVAWMKAISIKYNNKETHRRAVFVTADNKRKWILPRSVYDNYCEISFEGKKYMAIQNVDMYLTAMYGKYNELPPVANRKSHHVFKAWWKE